MKEWRGRELDNLAYRGLAWLKVFGKRNSGARLMWAPLGRFGANYGQSIRSAGSDRPRSIRDELDGPPLPRRAEGEQKGKRQSAERQGAGEHGAPGTRSRPGPCRAAQEQQRRQGEGTGQHREVCGEGAAVGVLEVEGDLVGEQALAVGALGVGMEAEQVGLEARVAQLGGAGEAGRDGEDLLIGGACKATKRSSSGRGPIRLIWPRATFRSWGSSSRRVARSRRARAG